MAALLNDFLVGSLRQLPEWQRDIAACYLDEIGLTLGRVERLVGRTFEQAIISRYREVVQVALAGAGGDLVQIAIKLRKHKSLRSRWQRGKVLPDWDTLCLAIAAFDVDLGGQFPRGREAARVAIKQTLRMIRVKLLHQAAPLLSDGDLACVHYAALSPQWWHAQRTGDPNHLVAATENVARKVASEVPYKRITEHGELAKVLDGWATCWFILQYVIPYDWQYPRVAANATHAP